MMMKMTMDGETIGYLWPSGVVLVALIILWSEICMSSQVRLMIIEAVYCLPSCRNR
jgi:hypothetical protein